MWRHVAAGKNRESRCLNRSCRSHPSHVSTKIGTDIESRNICQRMGARGLTKRHQQKGRRRPARPKCTSAKVGDQNSLLDQYIPIVYTYPN